MTDDATSPTPRRTPGPAPAPERYCRACGYPLTTAPDFCTCPECGKSGAKIHITCPPGKPLPTWPRFLLDLFGVPMGTLGLAVALMYASEPGRYVLPWLIALLLLIAAALLSLLVPLVVAIHWSTQSTMPFERRRRMISIIAIFALGAIVNLAIAVPVIRHSLIWAPTN